MVGGLVVALVHLDERVEDLVGLLGRQAGDGVGALAHEARLHAGGLVGDDALGGGDAGHDLAAAGGVGDRLGGGLEQAHDGARAGHGVVLVAAHEVRPDGVDRHDGVTGDGQGLPGRRDAPPHVDRTVQMPGAAEGDERVEMRGDVDDGRLLETTGKAAEDRHLLDHHVVCSEVVMRGEGQRAYVALQLIQLRDFVVV